MESHRSYVDTTSLIIIRKNVSIRNYAIWSQTQEKNPDRLGHCRYSRHRFNDRPLPSKFIPINLASEKHLLQSLRNSAPKTEPQTVLGIAKGVFSSAFVTTLPRFASSSGRHHAGWTFLRFLSSSSFRASAFREAFSFGKYRHRPQLLSRASRHLFGRLW